MVLRGRIPAGMEEEATIRCKEADEALTYAIAGLFCCVFLQPVAIQRALKARKMIQNNPQLAGSAKVAAAFVVAVVGIILWILGMLTQTLGSHRLR